MVSIICLGTLEESSNITAQMSPAADTLQLVSGSLQTVSDTDMLLGNCRSKASSEHPGLMVI